MGTSIIAEAGRAVLARREEGRHMATNEEDFVLVEKIDAAPSSTTHEAGEASQCCPEPEKVLAAEDGTEPGGPTKSADSWIVLFLACMLSLFNTAVQVASSLALLAAESAVKAWGALQAARTARLQAVT